MECFGAPAVRSERPRPDDTMKRSWRPDPRLTWETLGGSDEHPPGPIV